MSDRSAEALHQLPAPSRPKHLPLAMPSEAPSQVPARMVNEVLYCGRLAYLEWAQGEFLGNAYTVEGTLVHRRVDEKDGSLRAEEDDEDGPRPFEVRSVSLGSERLGLVAKIDLVEGEGSLAIPIETKRGEAPEIPGGAYLPERAQVCAQVLLLREHGFDAPHGEIYFARSRRRVKIEIDDTLIQQTLGAAARLRELTARGELPPPLEDSPKCKGCSLAPICLPDEIVLLRGLRSEPLDPPSEQLTFAFAEPAAPSGPEPDPWNLGPPTGEPEPPLLRRLVPARDEAVPLYVQSPHGRLSLDGELLRVDVGADRPRTVRLALTSHVALFGNIQVTMQALAALLDRDIPLVLFSSGGWYRGRTSGHGSKNIELRVAQHRIAADAPRAAELARSFVAAKIRNQRTMLRRNALGVEGLVLNELEALAKKAESAESVPSLLGLEGTAARYYFGQFPRMLKGETSFDLEGRNRRPPRDPVNAALSLAYALLVKDVALALVAVGLEPLLGFLHQPRYGRPALALDLMEEMRPLLADSVVITALNTGVLTADDFLVGATGCALKPAGRKRFIEAYERRMDQLVTHPIFGYRISYRRILEVQARLLSRVLLGEIPEYPAFRTR
jgi:CRISPR-associated protein Cas1